MLSSSTHKVTPLFHDQNPGGGGGGCGGTRACARARVEPDEEIALRYREDVGRPLTTGHMFLVRRFLSTGMAPEVIELAITETAEAPQPSARYFFAILSAYERDRVKTIDDWIERKQKFRSL